eukprot:TRINITY_DN8972_c0_g1_i1.p1 TRINITY_DN8972_c0_g1~~TRINITY_DN8972_c0_g1_i1.p1  ORF type:complete len:558 (-),score=98.45 TRINITY_DN8972_c0_g1_i1:232-1905(-)
MTTCEWMCSGTSTSSSSSSRSASVSPPRFCVAVGCSPTRCFPIQQLSLSRMSQWRLALLVLSCIAVLPGQLVSAQSTENAAGTTGPAYLEEGYCTSSASEADRRLERETELSIGSMDCAKLMEFIYVARHKVWSELDKDLTALNETTRALNPPTVVESLKTSSRAASLLSAHAHVITAVASQRAECYSEHVRLLLTVSLRRMKALATGQVQLLWLASQSGVQKKEDAVMAASLVSWLGEAAGLLASDLKTMKTVLSTWQPPTTEEARFYSHEADGRFSTMEALRRDTFEEYQLDKGLLQGLLRHVFPVDASIADFGAGSGHYSKWLNDTGLVTAYAFDGSPDISLVTRGLVAGADLGKTLTLWRRFDWMLCLEVAEHIPADLTPTFLKNLDAHGNNGLVISWAKPGLQGLGTANPLSEAQVLALLREHTGFVHLDEDLTRKARASSTFAHLAESLLVMTRVPRAGSTASDGANLPKSNAAAGCAAEEGWIYAGNDVQMFSSVSSAAACCELCNSNDQCRFWTWSREDSHKELCWIKATREYRINHAGFISGVKDTSA